MDVIMVIVIMFIIDIIPRNAFKRQLDTIQPEANTKRHIPRTKDETPKDKASISSLCDRSPAPTLVVRNSAHVHGIIIAILFRRSLGRSAPILSGLI